MKNRLLICFTAAAAALSAGAETPPLILKLTDGTERALSANGLTVSIENGELRAVTANGNVTVAIDRMLSMRFGGESGVESGIEAVGGVKTAEVEAFRLDGTAAKTLSRGVYIIREKETGKSHKTVIK